MATSSPAIWRPFLAAESPVESIKFYCSLFGWRVSGKYTHSRAVPLFEGSRAVAACAPPVAGVEGVGGWYPGFWVDDLDECCGRAAELGAKVALSTLSVAEDRFAVFVGPTREVFALVEQSPRERPDAADGSWLEVVTPDPAASRTFYGSLLGFRSQGTPERYYRNGSSAPFAGVVELHEDWDDIAFLRATGRASTVDRNIPPHWMPYFRVSDLDDVLERVAYLGGTVIVRHKMLQNLGPAAIVQDPAGATCRCSGRGDLHSRLAASLADRKLAELDRALKIALALK